MEVLDNGSHKDSENEAGGACRLLNIGKNSREVDVRLLLACKTQLSSEVVRLKTEALRLQKERDAARIRMKELDQILLKFTERIRDLENRLYAAEMENKRLRLGMTGLPNASALQKFSLSLENFHSYPWLDTQRRIPNSCLDMQRPPLTVSNSCVNTQRRPLTVSNSCLNTSEFKKAPFPPQEDWREVSQKLLEQMRQEMQELQQMSCTLQEGSHSDKIGDAKADISENKTCNDTLEDSFSHLMSESESLKHSLLKQRRTLRTLLNYIMQGNVQLCATETFTDEAKLFKDSDSDKSALSKHKPSTRHSDDSFHAFFVKHLEGCQTIDKIDKSMQLFMQSDTTRSAPKVTELETAKQNPEEERVCPICQFFFDASTPQKEFEEHVLDHLEVESASLLDQYVVL